MKPGGLGRFVLFYNSKKLYLRVRNRYTCSSKYFDGLNIRFFFAIAIVEESLLKLHFLLTKYCHNNYEKSYHNERFLKDHQPKDCH